MSKFQNNYIIDLVPEFQVKKLLQKNLVWLLFMWVGQGETIFIWVMQYETAINVIKYKSILNLPKTMAWLIYNWFYSTFWVQE